MIEFHNPPPFQLGQTVYVPIFSGPKKGKVESATIRCFNAVIFAKEATEAPKVFAVVEGVTFNSWFDFHREDQNYRLSELYATEAEAQAALKFYPVTASDDDWQKITGMHKNGVRVETDGTDDEASIDTSELTPCCGNISDARDLLYKCWTQAGLYQPDRDTLAVLLAGHEPPLTLLRLRKVLDQLGIEW